MLKWAIVFSFSFIVSNHVQAGVCNSNSRAAIYCGSSTVTHALGVAVTSGCGANFTSTKSAPAIQQPVNKCGSIIQVGSETLGEEINIVGSSFKLNYFSNRVPGRLEDYKIKVPITRSQIHSSVTGYTLKIMNDQNSVIHTSTYGTGLNQVATYLTNGLSSFGNEVWTTVPYKTVVTEVGSDFSYDTTTELHIGSLKNKKLGLGAWVPSIWYFYDASSKTLYKPNGTERSVTAETLPGNFYRVAEEDGSRVYIFDSTGKIVEIKLGLTGQNLYSFYYDSQERLAYIVEPFQRTTTFHRTFDKFSFIVSPNGRVTNVTLNSDGYLATVRDPKFQVQTMTYYGAGGLLASFKKPGNFLSSFTYDNYGNLTNDAHSGGRQINLAKTSNPNGSFVVSSATGMNRQDLMSVDSYDNYSKQEELRADGSKYLSEYSGNTSQKYSHNGSSQLVNYTINNTRFGGTSNHVSSTVEQMLGQRVKNFNNNITLTNPSDPFSINTWTRTQTVGYQSQFPVTSVYTGSTKTTVTTTQLGKTTESVIDDYQRPISIRQGNLNPVEMTYTDEKLTQITQGTRTTTFTYNMITKVLKTVTNALNQSTNYVYDATERLIKIRLPDLREINYTYDGNRNLTSITPPSRPAHTMTIGANEKVSHYNPPVLSSIPQVSTLYGYNIDNQLTSVTRPDGQALDYNYGASSGRLESVTAPNGVYTYEYGQLSNNISLPTKVIAPDNSRVELSYSGGVLSGQSVRISPTSTIYNFSLGTSQNSQLNAEYLSASNSININYTYDNDEYLSQAGDLSLTYSAPNGQLSTTTLGSINDERTYDPTYGELSAYSLNRNSNAVYSLSFERDLLGRITKKTETLDGVTTVFEYEYDNTGRLELTKKNGIVASTYSYDENSNRNGGADGSPITAVYDDQDRLLAYKSLTYTYNANGEMLSRTGIATTSYSYDVYGNMTGAVTPTKTINYEMDALGRRIGRKVNSVLQKRFAYDVNNRLIGEINTSGIVTKRFVYASKAHSPDYFVDNANVKYRIVTDHLGSVRLVLRESDGTVMQKMEHDEFGRVITDTNPGYQPFGFAGGIYDEDTRLVKFGARTYDPEIGRWTSKDPIRFSGGDTNLMGYTFNDPVNFIDPDGKFAGAVIGALIGGASGYAVSGTWQGAAIGAGAGAVSGTTMGAGIAAGAIIGAVSSAANQIASGSSVAQLNYSSIIASAMAGAGGGALGIGAANYLQVPFGVIGRAPGAATLNNLSNDIISSGIGGVSGALLDFAGQSVTCGGQ
ncbi:MAG: RHS repeat-associated core domain-containing protein [Bdellovibrionota bacterium]